MKRLSISRYLVAVIAFGSSGCSRGSLSWYTLSVQVETANSRTLGKENILPDSALHTHDTFAIRLSVDQPAYIYMVSSPEKGGPAVLPTGYEARLLPAGEILRLPSSNNTDVFQVDPPVGRETFFFAASRQPIHGDICRLWDFACPTNSGASGATTRGGSAPPPQKNPPPPPPPPPPPLKGLNGGNRDGALQAVTSDRKVVARSDGQGVARIRFTFRQIP